MATSTLNFQYNIDTAKTLALNQGKNVMVVFCRADCNECIRQYAIYNTTDFSLWLDQRFVVVSNDINQDPKTYVPFATGLNGAALPFVVLIDPKSKNLYYARFNGLMSFNVFQIQNNNAVAKSPSPTAAQSQLQQSPSTVVPSKPTSVDVVDEAAILVLEDRAIDSANKAKYYAEQAAINKKAADAILTIAKNEKIKFEIEQKDKQNNVGIFNSNNKNNRLFFRGNTL